MTVSSPRPLRLCLILHSTRSDNLGVGALTVAEVAILRDVARRLGREIDITILDWKDPRTPYVTGPDIRVVDLGPGASWPILPAFSQRPGVRMRSSTSGQGTALPISTAQAASTACSP